MQKVATELGVSNIDTVMYAWLLAHPANMIIVGSGKLDRVKTAALATKVNLDRQQWFTIFESSNGHPVPYRIKRRAIFLQLFFICISSHGKYIIHPLIRFHLPQHSHFLTYL